MLVMANVVAATMGGVWALRLTGTPFSISAAVGFISIFGVAVQDGVLLISYFNQMRGAGDRRPRGGDAGRRAAGPAGRHDLADGGPRAPARRRWRTRSARRRRSRWRSSSSAGCSSRSFLTRYLMPVLYSFFPAPAGHGQLHEELSEGSHYTDEILTTPTPTEAPRMASETTHRSAAARPPTRSWGHAARHPGARLRRGGRLDGRPARPRPRRRGGSARRSVVAAVVGARSPSSSSAARAAPKADARAACSEAYHFIAGPERKSPPPLAEDASPRSSTACSRSRRTSARRSGCRS